MDVIVNVAVFVIVVGGILVGAYYLLKKYDARMSAKIDAVIAELKEEIGKLKG